MISNAPNDPVSSRGPLKILALRRPAQCACGTPLNIGDRAAWDRTSRTVHCLTCATANLRPQPVTEPAARALAAEPVHIDVGIAGGSAQGEFDRRHARREEQVRAAHPRLGGVILALSDDPQSTRAWKVGAVGERRLAKELAGLGDLVVALHDRRVPRGQANIDHIVIGPAGIYVIDAKHYKNAKVAVRRSGGLLTPARQQLMVSGRDKSKLVGAMEWQVAAVRSALSASPEFAEVAITPALCFIGAEFPFFGTIEIGDVRVRGLGGIAKLVVGVGSLDATARARLAQHVAHQLPGKPPA